MRLKYLLIAALAMFLVRLGPATAQIGLGGVGGIGGPIGGLGGQLPGALDRPLGNVNRATGRLNQELRDVAQPALDLVGRPLNSARVLIRDERGAAIIRGEVLAVAPSEASLAIARQMRFTLLRQDQLEALGLSSATLQAPEGMDTIQALAALRKADPGGSYDYAHVYGPTGATTGISASGAFTTATSHVRIGMIDGGIEKRHPALSNAAITTQTFIGKGSAAGSVHGTAIASLLVGQDGNFSGYLPGAELYAADVFGGMPDGGSAAEIARALNWLAANNIAVTNISLAGPPNALLAAAVKSYLAGGHLLVAATGNDGPAAPPNYPAAYLGVIGVTSIDEKGKLELDANPSHALFAARGVNVRAASLPRGYASLTGTSYATPVITARLARLLQGSDAAGSPTAAVNTLIQTADRLDAGGTNPVYVMRDFASEATASQR